MPGFYKSVWPDLPAIIYVIYVTAHSILIAFQRFKENCLFLLLRYVQRVRQQKRRCWCPTLASKERPCWHVRPVSEASLRSIHCASGHTQTAQLCMRGQTVPEVKQTFWHNPIFARKGSIDTSFVPAQNKTEHWARQLLRNRVSPPVNPE